MPYDCRHICDERYWIGDEDYGYELAEIQFSGDFAKEVPEGVQQQVLKDVTAIIVKAYKDTWENDNP